MGITWSFELLSFLLADIHRTLDYFWYTFKMIKQDEFISFLFQVNNGLL